jgi:hypothetical protein
LFLLFFLGFFLGRLDNILFPDAADKLSVFASYVLLLLPIDLVLKLICKKQNLQFIPVRRFPDSNKVLRIYYFVGGICSLWNFYWIILFMPYIIAYLYPGAGIFTTIASVVILFATQVFTGQMSDCIRYKTNHLLYSLSGLAMLFCAVYIYVFEFHVNICPPALPVILFILSVACYLLLNINCKLSRYGMNNSSESGIFNNILLNRSWSGSTKSYISLFVKMVIRSPRLRQQFITFLILTIVYFYLYITLSNKEDFDNFPFKLFCTSINFILFPLIFNQYLFSAEASFFDHLMVIPNAKNILKARYITYVFVSAACFIILSVLTSPGPSSFFQLASIFLYSSGTITLLCFGSILPANTKIDLFGPHYKMMTNPPSGQSLIVLLAYAVSIFPVMIISLVFSEEAAFYFMFISGCISSALTACWLDFLYRLFCANKYNKMEKFRIQ